MSQADKDAMKAELGATCQANEGASGADMKALSNHEEPPNKAGKCVIACILETLGVVNTGTTKLFPLDTINTPPFLD